MQAKIPNTRVIKCKFVSNDDQIVQKRKWTRRIHPSEIVSRENWKRKKKELLFDFSIAVALHLIYI